MVSIGSVITNVLRTNSDVSNSSPYVNLIIWIIRYLRIIQLLNGYINLIDNVRLQYFKRKIPLQCQVSMTIIIASVTHHNLSRPMHTPSLL